ncbi:hypothetical protein JTE90_026940 [Oedothorax gibbosus]|uniref:Uncharacterized protein n=1 Tax=Oedothorax gibbosus TaxID=931172 RepID=A0AAV6TVH9_9ARAC|nr:hypothetical protein JTE90_026940 [Oedothorax gibbosus]
MVPELVSRCFHEKKRSIEKLHLVGGKAFSGEVYGTGGAEAQCGNCRRRIQTCHIVFMGTNLGKSIGVVVQLVVFLSSPCFHIFLDIQQGVGPSVCRYIRSRKGVGKSRISKGKHFTSRYKLCHRNVALGPDTCRIIVP